MAAGDEPVGKVLIMHNVPQLKSLLEVRWCRLFAAVIVVVMVVGLGVGVVGRPASASIADGGWCCCGAGVVDGGFSE